MTLSSILSMHVQLGSYVCDDPDCLLLGVHFFLHVHGCGSPFRLASIHADAPEFVEMSVEQEILVTGIKVVDLLAPYAKGGKIGE